MKLEKKIPRMKILYPLGQEVVSLTRNALEILLAGRRGGDSVSRDDLETDVT